MDKNAYGNYEYLPNNNSAMDTDEFLVVQDDGTLLLNRQVQYVAQVQDVKEGLDNTQSCAVYDVTAQQFFVDVTDNNSELISVADDYILPEAVPATDDTNNLYNNSFLIQVVPNENSGQTDKNLAIIDVKEKTSPDESNSSSQKGNNNCTEITLTDEQYKTLEQKGCVLLEANNKLFILDAYGLHEVATDSDLISSFKTESPLNEPSSSEKKETPESFMNIDSTYSLKPEPQLDSKDLPVEGINYENAELNVKEELPPVTKVLSADIVPVCLVKADSSNNLTEEVAADVIEPPKKFIKHVKVKTKYCFKDVPDKIVLGKTVNGKNIVAKVVKRTPAKHYNTINVEKSKVLMLPEKRDESNKPDPPVHLVKENVKKPDGSQWEALVQAALGRGAERAGAAAVAAAREIVAQLFHVPAIQTSVSGRNVIITKVEKSKKNNKTSIVTGVVTANDDGSCFFTHDPELLQGLMTKYIEHKIASGESLEAKAPDLTILHVNVSESKYENNVETISVVLNEHVLPCEALTRRPHVHKLHACSSCAAIFQSQTELEEHQEVHVMEAEDILTIDTDKLSMFMNSGKLYCEQNSRIEYSCYQCPMKFTKRNNYLKHMETHGETLQDTDSENKPGKINRKQPLYRCKMCNCSYFYPSTLAKHISTVHIKNKVIFSNGQLNPNKK